MTTTKAPCTVCGEKIHITTSNWWRREDVSEDFFTWRCACGHEASRGNDRAAAELNWETESVQPVSIGDFGHAAIEQPYNSSSPY